MSAAVANILDQVLNPLTESLSTESARRILDFRLDAVTRERIDALAAKASTSELTYAEREEYEEFVDAMDLVGILKAKARDAIARNPQ